MTLPPSQVGAAATQVKPSQQVGPGVAGMLSLPSNTKSAVLSIQPPFGAQIPGRWWWKIANSCSVTLWTFSRSLRHTYQQEFPTPW